MINSITFIRLASVFAIAAIALYAPASWQLLNVPLIIANILLDGFDSYITKKQKETLASGAMFYVATDRIIEAVLWMILASLGMVSIWVAIILITLGILIDSLHKPHTSHGKSHFGIMKTSIWKFLVAGRIMRFTVGFFKLITFSWLFFLIPAPLVWPYMIINHYVLFDLISVALVYTTVIICLARGIPVAIEALLCKN